MGSFETPKCSEVRENMGPKTKKPQMESSTRVLGCSEVVRAKHLLDY